LRHLRPLRRKCTGGILREVCGQRMDMSVAPAAAWLVFRLGMLRALHVSCSHCDLRIWGPWARRCNGLSYTMNYVDEAPKLDDVVDAGESESLACCYVAMCFQLKSRDFP
jgi:hypothetical protein